MLASFIHNALSFIIVIPVIVFIHELGHYYIAKRSGVKIELFSIGFGAELFGWNDKSGTRWKISAIPLGGYVKMFGDMGAASTPDNEKIRNFTEEEKKIAFPTKPLPVKAAIVAAGPIANFLLAIAIFTGFFTVYGKPVVTPVVNAVLVGSPADKAGIQPKDTILSIEGAAIKDFADMQRIVSIHPDEVLTFRIARPGQEQPLTLAITPKRVEQKDMFGNSAKVGQVGISSTLVAYHKLSLPAAVVEAGRETWNMSVATLQSIGQMIVGKRSTEELGGVLRIAKYSGQATSQGAPAVLWLIAILSVNLGLINLFPIPVLDGGHLMYYAIEGLRGRPLAEKYQRFGFTVGFAIVILLMVFSNVNDLRFFQLLKF